MNIRRDPRQRGMSLVEILVAIAIFTIIFVAALLIYDRSNRIFKQSNESADMQQNTRIAFDKMVSELRMTGFDYKRTGKDPGAVASPWVAARDYGVGALVTPPTPNGHYYRATVMGTSNASPPTFSTASGALIPEGGTSTLVWKEAGTNIYEQPDEQIEYAGQYAITIRGNFDAGLESGTESGRETALESGFFPVVTTGNDEIVTYALRSKNGPNTDTITYYADVNSSGAASRRSYPGGAVERLVTIDGVNLSNANPPYELMRITHNADGSLNRTPIADNIRSLEFQYFEDTRGTVALTDLASPPAPAPNIGGVGQYNPAAPTAAIPGRMIRSKIRAVRFELVGMNPQPDRDYTDAADTVAPNFRKFPLEGVIVPRNLGRVGVKETTGLPPSAPHIDSVCFGYCGVAVVSWTPGEGAEDETYTVLWDTDPAGSFSSSAYAGEMTQYAVDLTGQNLTNTFHFRVRARNASGTTLSDNTVSVSAKNMTKPNPPSGLVASGGGGSSPAAIVNAIQLRWTSPTTNASGSPDCTDAAATPPYDFLPAEIRGFRVYRGTTATFDPTDAAQSTLVVDETASGANRPVTDGVGNWRWTDNSVPSCLPYYYRIQAVEHCNANANYNDPADATLALSNIQPAFGSNAIQGQALAPPAPNAPTLLAVNTGASTCDGATNLCNVHLTWRKTTKDVTNANIAIDSYTIVRRQKKGGAYTIAPTVTQTVSGALAVSGPDMSFVDSSGVVQRDLLDGTLYTYEYKVIANHCVNSVASAPALYPAPCSFSGSIIILTGSVTGNGTLLDPWVMNTGDGLQVLPPSGDTLTQIVLDVYEGTTHLASFVDNTDPFTYGWTDRTDGVVYRLVFTVTNDDGCTEQLVRYVMDEAVNGCTLTLDDPDGTVFKYPDSIADDYQMTLDLKNESSETITLREIVFEWTKPSKVSWQSGTTTTNGVVFPSGAGYSPWTPPASGTVTVDLDPKPSALATSDVQIGASGTKQLKLNFRKTGNGSGSTVAQSNISKICVKYTRPSSGPTVLSCRIHSTTGGDSGPGNPTTCD